MSGPATLDWWRAGERTFADALGRLSDADLDQPSLLPGWQRRTVVAHVARNADALVNLLTWARTGVETPMYASTAARESGIADIAALPAGALRAQCRAAAERLAAALGAVPAAAWSNQVRTAQGRTVPAAEVPWMRNREVWVHSVDLVAGVDFANLPEDVLAALVDDVVAFWHRRGEVPDVTLAAGQRRWGDGSVVVEASLAELAGLLTGRKSAAAGPLRALPRWL